MGAFARHLRMPQPDNRAHAPPGWSRIAVVALAFVLLAGAWVCWQLAAHGAVELPSEEWVLAGCGGVLGAALWRLRRERCAHMRLLRELARARDHLADFRQALDAQAAVTVTVADGALAVGAEAVRPKAAAVH